MSVMKFLDATRDVIVDRTRIYDRIDRRGSPLVALLAPAGFGKTEVALEIARTHGSFIRIECSREASFSEELVDILGAINEEQTLILDNIECLEGRPNELASMRSLVNLHLGRRRVFLCGRRDPGVGFGSCVEPNRITVLRSANLAFTEDEMHALFEASGVDAGLLYRLYTFTNGWPMPALYCSRVAQSGNIEELFGETIEGSFADLLDYIDANVIATLPARVARGLFAAVGVPGIRTLEIDQLGHDKLAPPLSFEMMHTFEIASPRSSNSLDVNGLLKGVVRARHGRELHQIQREFADLYKERHDFRHAAQAYLSAGDMEAAATSLATSLASAGAASFDTFSPPPEIKEFPDLVSYPGLWAAMLGARRLAIHPSVLANEATVVLRALNDQSDPLLVITVTAMAATALLEDGRLEEAAALLSDFRERSSSIEEHMMLPILAVRAMIDSYVGAFDRSLTEWHHLRPFAQTNPAVFAQLMRLEIRAARARGEWEVELDALQRMLRFAEESRVDTVIGTALAEGVFGAWLAAESEILDDYRSRLGSLLQEREIPALVNFNLAARGLPLTSKALSKYWDALACLMVCTDTKDHDVAAALARSASELADDSSSAFTRVLARVALAEKIEASRSLYLQEAFEIAAAMDSIPLQRCLARLVENLGPFGILTPYIDRLRATSTVVPSEHSEDRVRISLGEAIVLRNDIPVNVSQGGWGLLAILSMEGHAVHRDVLCDRLWPTMSLQAGHNALKMCVRRTRLQLGVVEAIVSTQGGYALADWVEIDIVEMERLRAAISSGAFGDRELEQIAAYFEKMRAGRPERFLEWEWSSALEQRLDACTSAFGKVLCERAIAGGDYHKAIDVARYMVAADPLDETPRKMLISALVDSGDRATAMNEFRSYAAALEDELDVEPSSELKALIDA